MAGGGRKEEGEGGGRGDGRMAGGGGADGGRGGWPEGEEGRTGGGADGRRGRRGGRPEGEGRMAGGGGADGRRGAEGGMGGWPEGEEGRTGEGRKGEGGRTGRRTGRTWRASGRQRSASRSPWLRGLPVDVAAAVEMVHAFSLIHDDLPAMDDDTMRRGKPANHVVFGEGVAILAGNGLLTLSFQTLAGTRRSLGARTVARLVEELSLATGPEGVIGGQVLDLLSEGKKVPLSVVEYIHRHKTAKLFMASLRLGGIVAGATPAKLTRLERYGQDLGTAFQIVDDILGAVGSFRELGRDPGRDVERGKVTYPSVMGLPAAHRAVDRLIARAGNEARAFGPKALLFEGALALVDRRRRDTSGQPLGTAAS